MPELIGLPGVEQYEIEAVYVYSASELQAVLDSGKAATNANFNGAWNIWKDDDGNIRGRLMQYRKSIGGERKTDKVSVAQEWVREWNKFISNKD